MGTDESSEGLRKMDNILPLPSLGISFHLNRQGQILGLFHILPGRMTYSIQCQRHLETINYFDGPD